MSAIAVRFLQKANLTCDGIKFLKIEARERERERSHVMLKDVF